MKDKAINIDYSCFDVKANKHQVESELLTSDEDVAWSLLNVLLCFCLQCNSPANVIKTALQGTMLVITHICQKGLTHLWYSSQLIKNRMSEILF